MNRVISEILDNENCKDCILIKSKNHILVRDETLKMNASYIPKNRQCILFVAESPPMGFFKDRTQYFYAPGKIKYGSLFYYMMSVLFEKEMKEYRKCNKDYFLSKFLEEFYLIDMVKCPINKLSHEEKEETIKSCSVYLNKELQSLKFQKLVFIGKRSFKKVKKHLDLDVVYNVIPLPYHSETNVRNFRKELFNSIEYK